MRTCSNCAVHIGDHAQECPHCGTPVRRLKRGFFGQLFKLIFILFNVLMVLVIAVMAADFSGYFEGSAPAQLRDGLTGNLFTALGIGIGVWMLGGFLLWQLVYMTRPKE